MLKVNIPTLQDVSLYEVLRKICLLAISYKDIIKSGTFAQRPTSGPRFFYYATDDKQWFAYTGDATVGDNGWVIFG